MSPTDKKNTELQAGPEDANVVLAQREADLKCFVLRRQQIETLIKMIRKVTESIKGGSDLSGVRATVLLPRSVTTLSSLQFQTWCLWRSNTMQT